MQDVNTAISFENTENAFSYKSSRELKKADFLFSLINYNWLTKIGTALTPWAFKMQLPIKGLVRGTIFAQFCGGETLDECAVTTEKLYKHHVETILDYGVEAKETDEEFEKTTTEISKAIQFAGKNHHVPFTSIKITGICAMGLLEKLHAKQQLTSQEQSAWEKTKERFYRLCKVASENKVGLMVDAEETWIQNPINDLANGMMKEFNREKVAVLNTFQFYRTDQLQYLKESFEMAKSGNFLLGAKLVRGAYMEKERRRAAERGEVCLIQNDKISTDRDYDAAVEFCIDNLDRICVCIASHNEKSNFLGADLAMKKGIPSGHPHLQFSQLLGMSDNITFNLAHAGYNVTKYVPFGPVKDVVPYLMRRAQENTAVGGMSSRELMLIRKELKRRRG
ncbi:MAG: proline dehydrogenase family protein [Chitinophagales bacterium]